MSCVLTPHVALTLLLRVMVSLVNVENKVKGTEEDKKSLKIDTKVVIRICISKKNSQHNDQKKKYKRTNNDLQNIHIITRGESAPNVQRDLKHL